MAERLEEKTLLSVGPELVADIVAGAGESTPRELTNVNGTLFFSADDGANGNELWSMSVNSRPPLTTFPSVPDSTDEDTAVKLSFGEFLTKSDAADVDGTVDAFIVQAVTSGTLKIGTSVGSATAFAVGSNDKIDLTNKAYWTPDVNVNGSELIAFTVLAQDNEGANSLGPVSATVDVASVNDMPVLSNPESGFLPYAPDASSTQITSSLQVSDVVTEYFNQGTDTLQFPALTTDVRLNLAWISNQHVHANRTLRLNSGVTFENAIGGSGNDTFTGNSLNNTLTGSAGNDVLSGSDGDDFLIGGFGKNILIGGGGADRLTGGRTKICCWERFTPLTRISSG